MSLNDTLKIFSGSSNVALAVAVCKYLGVPLGVAKIDRFPDGEKVIKLEVEHFLMINEYMRFKVL